MNFWTASRKRIPRINKLMRYPNNLTRICYFVRILLYLFYYTVYYFDVGPIFLLNYSISIIELREIYFYLLIFFYECLMV